MENNMPKETETPLGQVQTKQTPALKPLPFNITQATRERFQSLFQKSNDQALNDLLNAYEQHQGNTPVSDSELQTENNSLRIKLKEAEKSVSENAGKIIDLENKLKEALKKNAQSQSDNAETKALESEILSLKSQLSEKTKEISELTDSVSEKDRMLREMDKLTKGTQDAQALKEKISSLEDELKENKKLLNGRAEQKKAYDDKIAGLEKEIEKLRLDNNELHTNLEAANAGKYTGSDDFLSYFEPIVAELLSRTAQKLTDERKDGITIEPSMVLGDIFLKYTLQKRTLWFYKWVLADSEILEIAKKINPNIQSVRMLRRVLNVDKELN